MNLRISYCKKSNRLNYMSYISNEVGLFYMASNCRMIFAIYHSTYSTIYLLYFSKEFGRMRMMQIVLYDVRSFLLTCAFDECPFFVCKNRDRHKTGFYSRFIGK